MNEKDLSQARNPLLPAAFEALRRAARRAREEAIRNQTDLVISEGGRIVSLSLSPQELERQLQDQREAQAIQEDSGAYATNANGELKGTSKNSNFGDPCSIKSMSYDYVCTRKLYF